MEHLALCEGANLPRIVWEERGEREYVDTLGILTVNNIGLEILGILMRANFECSENLDIFFFIMI